MTFSLTKAWHFAGENAPLSLSDATISLPAEDHIIVANHAIGINPVDWKYIAHNPTHWPKGHIPGVDGAGVVVAVGGNADKALVGQRVAYHHSLSKQGSFAQQTAVHAERVMRIPADMSMAQAAALPCPLLTAWQAFNKVPVVTDSKVLVCGMGAVNKFLVQLLYRSGFEVHVVSASLSESDATALGIQRVFRTPPQEGLYFALFDATDPNEARKQIPLLQANGHVVSILGRIETPVDPPFTRTISYHEIALGALHDYGDQQQWHRLMADGEQLMQDIVSGKLSLPSYTEFPFSSLNSALRYSKEEKQKAIVTIPAQN